MQQLLSRIATAGLLALLVACVQPVSIAKDRDLAPLPYGVELDFTSALVDPYVFTQAPFSGRRAVPVNRWTEEALRGYIDTRSPATPAPTLTLAVHLAGLTGSYHEQGLVPRPTLLGSSLLLGRGDRDHEIDVPEQIHKKVTLTGIVTLRSGSRQIHTGNVEIPVEQVITWETFDDRSYDFDDLVREAIRRFLLELDDLLQQALPESGK